MNSVSTRKVLAVAMLGAVGLFTTVRAQQVLYNSASIYVQPGTHVYVQGGVTNAGSGQINNGGTISLSADWVNNANNNVFISGGNGKVVLNGTTQTIGGSNPTNFEVLTLQNGSIKTATINTVVEDSLILGTSELAVGNNNISVTSPGVNAIQTAGGFVSNTALGSLSRATNSTQPYIFPLGSTIGVPRLRPAVVTPVNGNANTFQIGFVNNSATTDGYNTSNTQNPICVINNDWYHTVLRPSGSSAADVTLTFDNVLDNAFDHIANWNNPWTDIGTVVVVNNISPILSTITKQAYNTFTSSPYALTINTIPNTISPQGPISFCAGGSVVLQADQVQNSYQWHDQNGPIPGATNSTYTVTQAGTYSLDAGNGLCNVGSNQITVTVTPQPNANFTAPSTACTGDAPSTLVPVTPGGTFSGPGVSGTVFTPANAGPGTHTITYNITSGGCTGTQSHIVTVNSSPNVTISQSGPYCLNTPAVNLTGSPSGGTWSGTGITNPNTGTFNPSVSGTGTFTLTYNVTSSGCSGSNTTTVTVNSLPNASFTSPSVTCLNDNPYTLVPNTSGGAFSGPGITGSQFTPATAGTGLSQIIYIITDGNGCTNSDTNMIQVNANPNVNVTNVNPVCASASSFNITGTPANGTWSGTGITNPNTGTFNPQTSGPGTFTVTYTVTSNGCTGTGTTQVVVNALPNANFTVPNQICEDDAAVSFVPSTSGGSFTGTGITNPSGTFDPNVSGAGSFNITYTVTDGNGCTNSSTQSVTVDPAPNASFIAGTPNNGLVAFTSTSSGASTYTWNFGDGSPTSNVQNPSHQYQGSGTYTVTLIVTNACGSDTVTQQVTISFVGLDETAAGKPQVKVYPNPFKGATTLEVTLITSDIVDVEVYDMVGKKVYEIQDVNMVSGTNIVPLNEAFFNASAASYFVHVRTSNGFTSIHKLVKM